MRKINLQIENNIITGYTEIPLDENQKVYEFTDEQLKFIDSNLGKINVNLEVVESLKLKGEYLLKIEKLKNLLHETDYKAIKYAEGLISEEEYLPVKELRQSYRTEINKLEDELKSLEQ